MKVHLLLCHYRETYSGQMAPNVMLAVDEFLLEENPSWWPEAVAAEKAKVGDDAAAWAEMTVEVPTEAMYEALYPARKTVTATVVGSSPLPGLLEEPTDPAVHDPRIGVGSYVIDVDGDEDNPDDWGYVTEIVPGGYAVIWSEFTVLPRFAAADEVRLADGEPPAASKRRA